MISIDPERIGEVIGAGGKIINKIIEQTGVKSILMMTENFYLI